MNAKEYIEILESNRPNKIIIPVGPPRECHHCKDWVDEYDYYWKINSRQIICEKCFMFLIIEEEKKKNEALETLIDYFI